MLQTKIVSLHKVFSQTFNFYIRILLLPNIISLSKNIQNVEYSGKDSDMAAASNFL